MTDHVDDDDERDPFDDAPRVRVVTPRRTPATKRRPVKPSSRGRRGAEIGLGAVVVTAGVGFGCYALVTAVLGWPHDIALGVSCFLSGVCSGGVVWPLWRSARLAVAGFVHPARRGGA